MDVTRGIAASLAVVATLSACSNTTESDSVRDFADCWYPVHWHGHRYVELSLRHRVPERQVGAAVHARVATGCPADGTEPVTLHRIKGVPATQALAPGEDGANPQSLFVRDEPSSRQARPQSAALKKLLRR